ncbi:hypothetical protein [Microtetraspora malaysiensis]|nr:hypothetical protein [Microtetraspora malaysiensis]
MAALGQQRRDSAGAAGGVQGDAHRNLVEDPLDDETRLAYSIE